MISKKFSFVALFMAAALFIPALTLADDRMVIEGEGISANDAYDEEMRATKERIKAQRGKKPEPTYVFNGPVAKGARAVVGGTADLAGEAVSGTAKGISTGTQALTHGTREYLLKPTADVGMAARTVTREAVDGVTLRGDSSKPMPGREVEPATLP